jgi:hypothetical protein
VVKTTIVREPHILTDLLYVPMGWLIFAFFRPVLQVVSSGFMAYSVYLA